MIGDIRGSVIRAANAAIIEGVWVRRIGSTNGHDALATLGATG